MNGQTPIEGIAIEYYNKLCRHLLLALCGNLKRGLSGHVLGVAQVIQLPRSSSLLHQGPNHVRPPPLARGEERCGPAACDGEQICLLRKEANQRRGGGEKKRAECREVLGVLTEHWRQFIENGVDVCAVKEGSDSALPTFFVFSGAFSWTTPLGSRNGAARKPIILQRPDGNRTIQLSSTAKHTHSHKMAANYFLPGLRERFSAALENSREIPSAQLA